MTERSDTYSRAVFLLLIRSFPFFSCHFALLHPSTLLPRLPPTSPWTQQLENELKAQTEYAATEGRRAKQALSLEYEQKFQAQQKAFGTEIATLRQEVAQLQSQLAQQRDSLAQKVETIAQVRGQGGAGAKPPSRSISNFLASALTWLSPKASQATMDMTHALPLEDLRVRLTVRQ